MSVAGKVRTYSDLGIGCRSDVKAAFEKAPRTRLPFECARTQLQYDILLISPLPVTYQRSLTKGLPASRSVSQSARKIGGNGPRLAAGTLPTE